MPSPKSRAARLAVAALVLSSLAATATRGAEVADARYRAPPLHTGSIPRPILPPGYHDWLPVGHAHAMGETSRAGAVTCREMRYAISFGARLWEGYTAPQAVQALARAWPGHPLPCQFVAGLRIKPTEFAVRGDQLARHILLVRGIDQRGRAHFFATPVHRGSDHLDPQPQITWAGGAAAPRAYRNRNLEAAR